MFSTDKRWKAIAETLVHRCLNVQKSEKVLIAQYEIETWPLALATYESVIKVGGFPQIQLKSEHLRRAFMKYGNKEQYTWPTEMEIKGMEWADCYFALRGAFNLDIYHDIPANILAENQRAHGVVSTARWQNTRWTLSRVPNERFAQQAGLDLESITDMYFNASLLDYDKVIKKWRGWADKLQGAADVHILGKNTDLKFSIEGRSWELQVVDINIPGGEVYTSPVVDSINGHIYFENPGVLAGQLMHDLYLEWENGKLVKGTASTNQAFLDKILATDEGASTIGEFAIGLNHQLTHFTNDILWDENIYGTIHTALGRAYESTGGRNKSKIHWDIVKDLRQEGELIIDGKTIVKGGEIHL